VAKLKLGTFPLGIFEIGQILTLLKLGAGFGCFPSLFKIFKTPQTPQNLHLPFLCPKFEKKIENFNLDGV